jgi:hypothetical protein
VLAAPSAALAGGSSIMAGPMKVKGYDINITSQRTPTRSTTNTRVSSGCAER